MKRPIARSTGVFAASLALLAVAAGCGGGGASHGVKSSQKTMSSSAQAQIRQNWTAFFSSSTPPAKKAMLLQNGQRFERVMAAAAKSPLAKQTKAQVTSVRLQGPTRAKVVYSILLAGKPVLAHQVGTAISVNGAWLVSDQSFCGLLRLQGSAPSACAKP